LQSKGRHDLFDQIPNSCQGLVKPASYEEGIHQLMNVLATIGIDVSKDRLDVAVRPTGEHLTAANTLTGIEELTHKLTGFSPRLIVLEATGGYETNLTAALIKEELPVVMVNPRQVRDFAKAIGRLAKTDQIDADVLAHFGEAISPQIRILPDKQQHELSMLLSRQRQLVDMLTMEKNRIQNCPSQKVRQSVQAHIDWLNNQIKHIKKELDNFIQDTPAWRDKDKLYRSVPGVGPIVSAALLAYMPELGTLNRKKVAALAGLAPFNRDSGKLRGKRVVWGGRGQIRRLLYMATVASLRVNPVIQSFFQRLVEAGKPKKAALTACMRKLLTILNAMAKSNLPWSHVPLQPAP